MRFTDDNALIFARRVRCSIFPHPVQRLNFQFVVPPAAYETMKTANLFLILASLFVTGVSAGAARPNFVIIFTDDQGYGDLGCFGSTTIRTPRLDALAREGTRFTSFYVQVVCGPSRSALLTGRYRVRSGGRSMPASEITIAELLKKVGYATCALGKW